MKASTFLASVLMAVVVVSACSTIDRTVYDQKVSPVTNSATGEIALRTNLVVKPGVQAGVDVVGMIPTPYTAIGSAAAGLLLAGYAAWRGSRSKKTNVALVKGVESFRGGLPEAQDSRLTAILIKEQSAAGVRPEVVKILEKIRS